MRQRAEHATLALLVWTWITFPSISYAQVWAEMHPAGGGQTYPDLWVRPEDSLDLYMFVFDGSDPIPNLQFTFCSIGAYPQEGGHDTGHSGWGWGGITPSQGQTGPNGEPAAFRYNAGPAAGWVWPALCFEYLREEYVLTPVNGLIAGVSRDDLPYIGSGAFVLVGATSRHPDNHYGQGWFLDGLRVLAADYNARWPEHPVLAFNDSSLRRGGIFDLGGNYGPPHHEHREGTSQDVRANGGPNSIPFISEVRQWFEERVFQIFGQYPLHESAGTSNEHYHIRG